MKTNDDVCQKELLRMRRHIRNYRCVAARGVCQNYQYVFACNDSFTHDLVISFVTFFQVVCFVGSTTVRSSYQETTVLFTGICKQLVMCMTVGFPKSKTQHVSEPLGVSATLAEIRWKLQYFLKLPAAGLQRLRVQYVVTT